MVPVRGHGEPEPAVRLAAVDGGRVGVEAEPGGGAGQQQHQPRHLSPLLTLQGLKMGVVRLRKAGFHHISMSQYAYAMVAPGQSLARIPSSVSPAGAVTADSAEEIPGGGRRSAARGLGLGKAEQSCGIRDQPIFSPRGVLIFPHGVAEKVRFKRI